MKFSTVIFDMDGVLIDSEPIHLDAANEVLGLEGGHLTENENSVYLGCNEARYWAALVERFALENDPAHYIALRHQILVRMLKDKLPISPGVVDLLRRLKAQGCKLALASSSERGLIDYVVDKGGMTGIFDVIASGDEVENSKPDPEIFLLAAKRLNSEPGACLVFEDSANGIQAAIGARMSCIRVETKSTQGLKFPKVSATISSFVDLDMEALLNLERKNS